MMSKDMGKLIKEVKTEWLKMSLDFYKYWFRQATFWDTTKKKWKARNKSYDHPPLYDTHNMYKGIKGKITTKGIAIYNDVKYAIYHNEGEGKMPQRQFIGQSDELDSRFLEMADKKITKFFYKENRKNIQRDINKYNKK